MMRSLAFGFLTLLPWAGYANESPPVPLPHGSTTIITIQACSPDWQSRIAVPVKITDRLMLAVPVKYIRHELQTCGKTTGGIPQDAPSRSSSASFEFFLPNFGGFTDESLREPFGADEVQVAYIVASEKLGFHPSDPAELEKSQAQKVLKALADTSKYRDMYGLRCYEGKIAKNRMFCTGVRGGVNHVEILFQVDSPPYGAGVINPLMRTEYFSQRYGGIEISWWTNVKNMSSWLKIDEQIWKFLNDWNIAKSAR